MLLNKKPNRWFYLRNKQHSNQVIEALVDHNGEEKTDSQDLLRVAVRFYLELYDIKPTER